MNEWIRAQMEKGFKILKGLQLTATVPLRDQIINDAVARFLVNPPAPPSAGFDLREPVGVRRAGPGPQHGRYGCSRPGNQSLTNLYLLSSNEIPYWFGFLVKAGPVYLVIVTSPK